MSRRSSRASPRLNKSSDKESEKFLRPKPSRSGRQNYSQMSESEETPRTLISNVLGGLDSEVPVTRQHTRVIPTPAPRSSKKRLRSSVSKLVHKATMNDMRQNANREETPRTLIRNVLETRNDVTPVLVGRGPGVIQHVKSSQHASNFNPELSKNESAHDESYLHDYVPPSQLERDPSSQLGSRQIRFKLDRLNKAKFAGENGAESSQSVLPSPQEMEVSGDDGNASNNSSNSNISISVDSFMKDYVRPSQEIQRSQSSQLGNRKIRLDPRRLQQAKFIDSNKKKERQRQDRINRTANLETLEEFDPGAQEQDGEGDEARSESLVAPSVNEMDDNAQPLPDLSVHEVTEGHAIAFQRDAVVDAGGRRSMANKSRVSMRGNSDVSTAGHFSQLDKSRVSMKDLHGNYVDLSGDELLKRRQSNYKDGTTNHSAISASRIYEDESEMSPRIERKRIRRSLVLDTEDIDERRNSDDPSGDEQQRVIPDSQRSGWEQNYPHGRDAQILDDQHYMDDREVEDRSSNRHSLARSALVEREGHRKQSIGKSFERDAEIYDEEVYEGEWQMSRRSRVSSHRSVMEKSLNRDGHELNSMLNDEDAHVDEATGQEISQRLSNVSRRSSRKISTFAGDIDTAADGMMEEVDDDIQQNGDELEYSEWKRSSRSGHGKSDDFSRRVADSLDYQNMDSLEIVERQRAGMRTSMANVSSTKLTSFSAALDRMSANSLRSSIGLEANRHNLSSRSPVGLEANRPNLSSRSSVGVEANRPNLSSRSSVGVEANRPNLSSRSSIGVEVNRPVSHVAPLKELSVSALSNASNVAGTSSRRGTASPSQFRSAESPEGRTVTDTIGQDGSAVSRRGRRLSRTAMTPFGGILGHREGPSSGTRTPASLEQNEQDIEAELTSFKRTPQSAKGSRMSHATSLTRSPDLRSASKNATPWSGRGNLPKSGKRPSVLQSRENTPQSKRGDTPQPRDSVRTPHESSRAEYLHMATPSGDQTDALPTNPLHSATRQGSIQTYFSPLDSGKKLVENPQRVNLLEKLISGSQKNRQVLNTHRERLQPLAKKPRAKLPVQRSVKAPRDRKKKEPRVPSAVTKSIFTHFSRCRVPRESLQKIEEISDVFWKNIVQDLSALAGHAGRKTVTKADVEVLMRRQGFLNRDQNINLLIESHLPLEYRKELIPMARSGNVVVPKE